MCCGVLMECKACGKNFVNKYSLARHHERMPLCVEWISTTTQKVETTVVAETVTTEESICNIWIRVRERIETIISLPGATVPTCRYCSHAFTRMSSLHDHYSNNTVCNKFALRELEKQLPGMGAFLKKYPS